MSITYKNIKEFDEKELEDLFLSVEWSSGKYPDKLKVAMLGFDTVFSAWDSDKLIGLICVMSDGIMNAYVHYLLVNPAYQGKGVGKKLVNLTKERYKDFLRIAIIAYDDKIEFYNSCGFVKSSDSSPMFITTLTT